MKIGIIGLGRMGDAIAQRVLQAGHEVVGYDPNAQAREHTRSLGAQVVETAQEIAQKSSIIWLMVPAGKIVDDVIAQLMPALASDAIIIDGGNSKFTDSIRRADELQKRGIAFLDCGTSGGVHGREQGFSLMVGGDVQAYTRVLPLLKAIAAPHALGLVGPSGAGHYVKMVHNGIEYALLEAYAEGFELIKQGSFKDQDLDLYKITGIWNHGSVIRSWLLELSHDIFAKDQKFENISGEIAESGTGSWTVQEAQEHKIPVPCIEKSLDVRSWSRKTGGNYATKIVALLRNAFGGHAVGKK